MIDLTGKGMYIWNMWDTCHGNVDAMVEYAKTAKLSHVMVKIANGYAKFNIDRANVGTVSELITKMHAAGIQVWGWHYIYNAYNRLEDGVQVSIAEAECIVAIQRVAELPGLDGFIVDAEDEAKKAGYANNKLYMDQIRTSMKMPIALSSYRFPTIHQDLAWNAFIPYCDIMMPQVYWFKSTNAGEQLRRSYKEYKALAPNLPFIPTGASYQEDGWRATEMQIIEFSDVAKELKLPCINFWEWANAQRYNLWDAVARLDWPVQDAPEPEPEPEPAGEAYQTLYGLNVRSAPRADAPRVGSLNAGSNIDVTETADQTVWGKIGEDKWVCLRMNGINYAARKQV